MDNEKQVPVDVLYWSPKYVKVKLPFVEVPIKMNRSFFNRRIRNGYFKLIQKN